MDFTANKAAMKGSANVMSESHDDARADNAAETEHVLDIHKDSEREPTGLEKTRNNQLPASPGNAAQHKEQKAATTHNEPKAQPEINEANISDTQSSNEDGQGPSEVDFARLYHERQLGCGSLDPPNLTFKEFREMYLPKLRANKEDD